MNENPFRPRKTIFEEMAAASVERDIKLRKRSPLLWLYSMVGSLTGTIAISQMLDGMPALTGYVCKAILSVFLSYHVFRYMPSAKQKWLCFIALQINIFVFSVDQIVFKLSELSWETFFIIGAVIVVLFLATFVWEAIAHEISHGKVQKPSPRPAPAVSKASGGEETDWGGLIMDPTAVLEDELSR